MQSKVEEHVSKSGFRMHHVPFCSFQMLPPIVVSHSVPFCALVSASTFLSYCTTSGNLIVWRPGDNPYPCPTEHAVHEHPIHDPSNQLSVPGAVLLAL
jgi:hypothetical protein